MFEDTASAQAPIRPPTVSMLNDRRLERMEWLFNRIMVILCAFLVIGMLTLLVEVSLILSIIWHGFLAVAE